MAKNMSIKFINMSEVHQEYYPIPAKNVLPDWYKDSHGHMDNVKINYKTNDEFSSTIKKCMPIFDAMTTGYILVTHEDMVIEGPLGKDPYYHWVDDEKPSISFHNAKQLQEHPKRNDVDNSVPKWTNNWAIKTSPGYSCMFINPLHRESPISIFEGVVDTDVYTAEVLLPFTLKDKNWRGLIPAGTPIAQVIPFRRDTFIMEVSNDHADIHEVYLTDKRLKSTFLNAYKKKFWSKKEYN